MKNLTVLLVIVFLAQIAASASIGVSPGFINYNEVNPGTELEVKFYLTTTAIDDEFTVSPEYGPAVADYAMGENPTIDMSNVSQQDISPWISFDQQTKTIDPTTSQQYTLPNGNSVNAEGVVTMNVDIPANAEPGYRIGSVSLNPKLETGGGGGARLVAQTQPGFAFRIPGNVEREIEHVGMEAYRVGENQIQMINQFRNTGTVTTTIRASPINVYNSEGEKLGSYFTNSATLEPGEYAEMSRVWSNKQIKGGEYRIEGTAEYLPGETYISGQFGITDIIEQRRDVNEPSGGEAENPSKVPWLLIIIISVLAATLLYMMDIDEVWIIAITVFSAATLYIMLGPASNLLILIPLIAIAVLLYV